MGRRKQGDDDETLKGRLLDRLGELFFTGQGASFTMDEIAKTFRLSKKTIYRFFPTKDEMIIQVSKIFGSRIKAFVERKIKAIEKEGPGAFIPRTKEMLSGMGSILLSLSPSILYALEKDAPLAFRSIDSMRRKIILECFERIVDLGKGFGVLRADIDSALAAHIYAGMIGQIVSRQDLGPEHSPYQVYLTVVKIMFEGILKQEAKEPFASGELPKMDPVDPWRLMTEE